MGATDYIVIAVIAVIIGAAVAYIIKAKKSGRKCIGCPDSKTCAHTAKDGCKSCTSCSSCTSCPSCNKSK